MPIPGTAHTFPKQLHKMVLEDFKEIEHDQYWFQYVFSASTATIQHTVTLTCTTNIYYLNVHKILMLRAGVDRLAQVQRHRQPRGRKG